MTGLEARDSGQRYVVEAGAMRFRRVLGRAITMMGIPFGYTLAIWGSGAVLVLSYGARRR